MSVGKAMSESFEKQNRSKSLDSLYKLRVQTLKYVLANTSELLQSRKILLIKSPEANSPWNSLGQNTGVGSLSLLQGIVPTQGSNPGLPHCRRILYQLSN